MAVHHTNFEITNCEMKEFFLVRISLKTYLLNSEIRKQHSPSEMRNSCSILFGANPAALKIKRFAYVSNAEYELNTLCHDDQIVRNAHTMWSNVFWLSHFNSKIRSQCLKSFENQRKTKGFRAHLDMHCIYHNLFDRCQGLSVPNLFTWFRHCCVQFKVERPNEKFNGIVEWLVITFNWCTWPDPIDRCPQMMVIKWMHQNELITWFPAFDCGVGRLKD